MIDAQLMTQFRKLRLGGIADTIEVRLSQARQDELSHWALLSLLMQDEIERREAKKRETRLKKAAFIIGVRSCITTFLFSGSLLHELQGILFWGRHRGLHLH